jgi:nucleoside-diphosphate-sugar epimerase
MRALVTGGAGFIGSAIAKELASNGAEVVARLADISAAGKAFGFEPAVTIDEGLLEYIRWARTEVAS